MFAGDEATSGDEDGATSGDEDGAASEEGKNEETRKQQPSGGAGGSKATPLAGPTACARVSSLSLQDGFDFSYNDQKGPADGHSARLVAAFIEHRTGALYGLHQCGVKLRCTRDWRFVGRFICFPFVECSDSAATLLLSTGTLVVRTGAGACCVYDVAGSMQREFGNAVKLSRDEWQETRPWLALPWHNARIYIDDTEHPPLVVAAIVHEHMIPERIRNGASSEWERCHSRLYFPRHAQCCQPLPFIMRRLLLGVRYLPAEERWRQRAVAVLLALHPRTGKDSPMRVLLPDVVRKIMQLEYSTPEITEIGAGPGGGSLSPTPDVKAALTLIRAVGRRRRGGGGSGFRRGRKRRQAGTSCSSFSR